MLKNMLKLEVKVEGRDYILYFENESPLVCIKEALFQYQKYLGQIEDQIKKQQEQQEQHRIEEEQKKQEEPASEWTTNELSP